MRAAAYDSFGGPVSVIEAPTPAPGPNEALIRVMATGVCRSDWHGWQGHDSDIASLPHVPGHEFAGTIEAVGDGVSGSEGDRVVVPFVAGCGTCAVCQAGDPQICPRQFQPGFTHWGSFAEFVIVKNAEANLVPVPEAVGFDVAAALGCRFTTAYRAVAQQGQVNTGQWVAVHGCGGVGLSAVLLAKSLGARVVAVDVHHAALELAADLGADVVIRAGDSHVADRIADATSGGAHVSIDAIGHPQVVADSIRSLRRRGRHVQVGLVNPELMPVGVPLDRIVAWELEVLGSHGAAPSVFPPLMRLIESGELDVESLITRRLGLHDAEQALVDVGAAAHPGVTVLCL